MATPSKFTAARRKVVLEGVEEGLSFRACAALAGITHPTLLDWLKKGQARPGGRYGEFLQHVEEAQARFEQKMVGLVTDGATDDPNLALKVLERRRPDDWAKRERHEVTGPDGGAVRVELQWPTGTEPPR